MDTEEVLPYASGFVRNVRQRYAPLKKFVDFELVNTQSEPVSSIVLSPPYPIGILTDTVLINARTDLKAINNRPKINCYITYDREQIVFGYGYTRLYFYLENAGFDPMNAKPFNIRAISAYFQPSTAFQLVGAELLQEGEIFLMKRDGSGWTFVDNYISQLEDPIRYEFYMLVSSSSGFSTDEPIAYLDLQLYRNYGTQLNPIQQDILRQATIDEIYDVPFSQLDYYNLPYNLIAYYDDRFLGSYIPSEKIKEETIAIITGETLPSAPILEFSNVTFNASLPSGFLIYLSNNYMVIESDGNTIPANTFLNVGGKYSFKYIDMYNVPCDFIGGTLISNNPTYLVLQDFEDIRFGGDTWMALNVYDYFPNATKSIINYKEYAPGAILGEGVPPPSEMPFSSVSLDSNTNISISKTPSTLKLATYESFDFEIHARYSGVDVTFTYAKDVLIIKDTLNYGIQGFEQIKNQPRCELSFQSFKVPYVGNTFKVLGYILQFDSQQICIHVTEITNNGALFLHNFEDKVLNYGFRLPVHIKTWFFKYPVSDTLRIQPSDAFQMEMPSITFTIEDGMSTSWTLTGDLIKKEKNALVFSNFTSITASGMNEPDLSSFVTYQTETLQLTNYIEPQFINTLGGTLSIAYTLNENVPTLTFITDALLGFDTNSMFTTLGKRVQFYLYDVNDMKWTFSGIYSSRTSRFLKLSPVEKIYVNDTPVGLMEALLVWPGIESGKFKWSLFDFVELDALMPLAEEIYAEIDAFPPKSFKPESIQSNACGIEFRGKDQGSTTALGLPDLISRTLPVYFISKTLETTQYVLAHPKNTKYGVMSYRATSTNFPWHFSSFYIDRDTSKKLINIKTQATNQYPICIGTESTWSTNTFNVSVICSRPSSTPYTCNNGNVVIGRLGHDEFKNSSSICIGGPFKILQKGVNPHANNLIFIGQNIFNDCPTIKPQSSYSDQIIAIGSQIMNGARSYNASLEGSYFEMGGIFIGTNIKHVSVQTDPKHSIIIGHGIKSSGNNVVQCIVLKTTETELPIIKNKNSFYVNSEAIRHINTLPLRPLTNKCQELYYDTIEQCIFLSNATPITIATLRNNLGIPQPV